MDINFMIFLLKKMSK